MKILHLCLSCFYIDNFNYQENILPRQNKLDGHEVKIIASTETFINSKLAYVEAGKYLNEDGIEVIRLPYSKMLPYKIMRKLRFYKGVEKEVKEFNPDIIFFHGTAAGELGTITNYIKQNKGVKLYIDSHEDFHNTARTKMAKMFYKYIQGYFLKRALPFTKKIFYISLESRVYLKELYKIPEDKLEWYPLGGIVFDDEKYDLKRKNIRKQLNLKEEILFVHSGKMNAAKKTESILKAFSKIKNPGIRLVLIGSFPDDIWEKVRVYIEEDERISFLGWKSGEELMDYLCAADFYLQPGTQSATMQNAICCRCGVMLYPYSSHVPFLKENGFYVRNTKEIYDALEKICDNRLNIEKMKLESEKIGREILDYRKLAARIY